MIRFIGFVFLVLTFSACQQEPQYNKLSGNTMGTKYNITFDSNGVSIDKLQSALTQELETINQLMSTYIPDSEINQFNALTTDACFQFSERTWTVLVAAKDVYHQTNGAFDITVGPLIQRWGFDAAEYDEKVPTEEEVKLLHETVGTDQLEYDSAKQCISKTNPKLTINLSAIAKGFAVDQLADIMAEFQISNYLVEIGGETKGQGVNVHGYPWRIAVEKPSSNASQQELLVIALESTSIATSGDYRNYFEVAGKRFSHTIDPTTGYPIEHNLTSVSVIHPSNMYADAYATAMSVLGGEASLEFADQYQLPVLVIERQNDELVTHANNLFEKFFIK
ncbi:FAD:protein FMN transferase [Kangiella koreensis]|uniref:FAD:protein FMN transferase n=1 Tax=Kangiella koreensis (strain DSM 16069 / JCM 12317 / KCTC 12182 / SW-125) TaxID=523791 RepID=C7R8K4_KANKD|nr:FAD:protein FMN transferase [Kangiella koreensis]ACV27769.1 ApbE family lipoprotein [Kangiella koreensis DSM 16069]